MGSREYTTNAAEMPKDYTIGWDKTTENINTADIVEYEWNQT